MSWSSALSLAASIGPRAHLHKRLVNGLLGGAALLALAACGDTPNPGQPSEPPPPPPPPAYQVAPAPMPAPPPAPAPSAPATSPAPDQGPAMAPIVDMAPIPNPTDSGDGRQRVHARFGVGVAGRNHTASHGGAVAAAGAGGAAIAEAKAAKVADAAADTPDQVRAKKLALVQAALVFGLKSAVLTEPVAGSAGKPTQVTLDVPSTVGDAVRKAAEDQGLVAAGSAISLAAGLGIDGYSIDSPAVQTQPVVAGQPTQFHWNVTAKEGEKSAPKASVCVQLASGDPQMCGTGVEGPDPNSDMRNKYWGLGLLVAAAVALIAWVVVRREQPKSGRSNRPPLGY